jgi:ATP-binding cassette subfamily B protein
MGSRSLRIAWPYLVRHRAALASGMTMLVLKDLAAAGWPLVMRAGIDSISREPSLAVAARFAGGLLILSLLKGFFQYWMRIILVGMSRDVEYDLRNDLFAHLTRLSQDFYGRTRTGDVMARATNDLNQVRMMLGPGLMYWFETMLLFVLAVGVMLSVDWQLTLTALAPAPFVSLAVIYFGRRIHSAFEKIQEMFASITSSVQESLANIRVVRAFVQEEPELQRFLDQNRAYAQANEDLAWRTGLFSPLLQALIGLTFLIVLWAGGLRLMSGALSLGSFVMFQGYMNMLIWPMIAFGWVINLTQRGTASLERIGAVLEEIPGVSAPPDPHRLDSGFRGEIEFRDVTLRYGSRTAVNHLSLKVEAGSTVAIVGQTGSGKTSLVSLVPRLLDPASGCVLIDGIDVRRLDPAELRRRIGFVPQETFLFSATIAENIAFGVPGATRQEVADAARLAGLEADLLNFPAGFDTMIGERGVTLSGGQKQRTAIARALLRNPRILILDDALSSVDTVTEERILSALTEVMRDRTAVLISHRVSTVRGADWIYVIEDGRVAEQGTHDQLLERGGYYAGLHQKQLLEEELQAA